MKRLFRQMDDATKMRISQRLRNRSLSDSHKQAIADSMKAYWATIPNRPNEINNEVNDEKKDETNM